MPEISVVMPVYNSEKYLAEAIESILNQTFGDFEFVIVYERDCNEASVNILERYAAQDKRIRLIHKQSERGVSSSLNIGLDAARGKYIARMDADDISGPRRFEVQKMFLDTYPEIGVCGTSQTVINAKRWLVDYVSDPDLVATQLLFFVAMRHPTIMFRSELTEKCRYDVAFSGAEDYDMYYQFSKVTKLSNILDDSLFQYRRTGENVSIVYAELAEELWKQIQSRIMKETLELEFTGEQMNVLHILSGIPYRNVSEDEYPEVMHTLEELLETIERRNEELGGGYFVANA